MTGVGEQATRFALICRCGRRLEGRRTDRPSRVRCPACGKRSAVLPVSPLVRAFGPRPVSTFRIARASRRRWARVASLVLLAGLTVGVFVWITRPGSDPERSDPPSSVRTGATREAGFAALREGDYERAARLFGEAAEADVPAGRAELEQLRRQSSLLSDLLAESLSQVLRRLPGVSDAAWRSQFERRYRGRAVVFDARFFRNAAGKYQFDYEIVTRDGTAIIAWDELILLTSVPLKDPERLVIGARLEACERTPAGWVIRLQPDSGVLFTEPEMFRGTSLPPPDEELLEVFRRQAGWLEGCGG